MPIFYYNNVSGSLREVRFFSVANARRTWDRLQALGAIMACGRP